MRYRLAWDVVAAACVAACLAVVPAATGAAGKAGGGGKAAKASKAAVGTVRVATWNLKWFGHPQAPRSTADLAAMAALIAAASVDVLALQEVAVTRIGPSGEPRSYALDELSAILETTHGTSWEYWLHKGQGEQHLGYMWRPDRVDLEAAPLLGLKAGMVENVLTDKKGGKKVEKKSPWPRAPVVARIVTGEGLTDFTLVNLHLKAADPAYGADSYWESRKEACASIAKWAKEAWAGAAAGGGGKGKGGGKGQGPGKAGASAQGQPAQGKIVPGAWLVAAPPLVLQPGKYASAQKATSAEVLGKVDPDLAVIGDFNSPVNGDMDAAPLLESGFHFLGAGEPTHKSGSALDRVAVSVAMGEENSIAGNGGPGEADDHDAFDVQDGDPVGGTDHLMVWFEVAVRPDDD